MSDLEDWENEDFDEFEDEVEEPVQQAKPVEKKPARERDEFTGELLEDEKDEDDIRISKLRKAELTGMELARDMFDVDLRAEDGAAAEDATFESLDPKVGKEFDQLADMISAKLLKYRDDELQFIPTVKRIMRSLFAEEKESDNTKEMVDICSVIHNETVARSKQRRRKGKKAKKAPKTKKATLNLGGSGAAAAMDDFDAADEYDFM